MLAYALVAFLIFRSSSSDFESDLKLAVDEYKCKPNCTFNHSELTSKTIEFFPTTCYTVCGIITINENTDLSYAKLESVFAKIGSIGGGLQIQNTKLKTISFLRKELSIQCFPIGTRIVNNSELVDVDVLHDVHHIQEYNLSQVLIRDCDIQILNNTKLDASEVCESQWYWSLTKMEVYDNKKDCGCRGGVITARNLKNFKNCIGLFDGLKMTNMSYNANLNSLQKIRMITGNVEIAFTNFTDLSFLKSLWKVRGTLLNSVETVILDIHDNPNLKRIGIPIRYFLQNIESNLAPTMNLENLHPDFCLTFQEASQLALVNARFKNLQAKFCDDELETEQITCHLGSLADLASDCVIIFGDLLIDSENEEYVENLEKVQEIYGSLTIQNTQLKDLKFIKYLSSVYYLHDSLPAIRISNNTKLASVSLSFMSRVFAKGKRDVIFEGNAPGLFRASISCLAFQSHIHGNVTYNGKNCKAIDLVNGAAQLAKVIWILLFGVLIFC